MKQQDTTWKPHGFWKTPHETTVCGVLLFPVVSNQNDQSLKAHNFYNNGPIFNPLKVLESSWSPLSVCAVQCGFYAWK